MFNKELIGLTWASFACIALAGCGGGGGSDDSVLNGAGDVLDIGAAIDGDEVDTDSNISDPDEVTSDSDASDTTETNDSESSSSSGSDSSDVASGKEPGDSDAPKLPEPDSNSSENSVIEPPLGFAGEIQDVVTPFESDPFSKFQLDDQLYTNNVYDGRQLDASNGHKLIFRDGVQDFVRWEVPALLGSNPSPCVRPQSADPVTLSYRLTSRIDSPTCLLYTSPSPRDGLLSRMPSSA